MQKKGKIINIISNIFYVEIEDRIYECSSRGIFKTKDKKPVVGDNVIVDLNKNSGNILEIYNRKVYIKRPKMANISQIVLVVSAKDPEPDLLMLDKQIAFAEFLGIKPIIVINKIDLNLENANNIEKTYSKIGYKVIKTVAKEQINIQEINEILNNNISAFSGNSGVGKSTLINSIFDKATTLEGEISKKNKKGKNTTTSVNLYKITKNTYIADTPGFSNYDICEIEYKELYKYFIEFNKYTNECEYLDCTHIKEKECGIKQALINNDVSQSRYDNFRKIYEELKDREEHKW